MFPLDIVVLKLHERAVLAELGRLGIMELRPSALGPEVPKMQHRDCAIELTGCDTLRARSADLRKLLGLPRQGGAFSERRLPLDEAQQTLVSLEMRAGELCARRDALRQGVRESELICRRLSPYNGLGIPIKVFKEPLLLKFLIGSVLTGQFELLQEKVRASVVLLPLCKLNERQIFVAVADVRYVSMLNEVLRSAEFQEEQIPEATGTTLDAILEDQEQKCKSAMLQLEQLDLDICKYADETSGVLNEIERAITVERLMLEAEQKFAGTASTVIISGWVPETEAVFIEERLNFVTEGHCIFHCLPRVADARQIPVMLRHSRFVRPFEMLVSAYGLPTYNELEPTVLVGLSYMLMFGMMFGDAGQGCVLGLVGMGAFLAGRSRKVQDAGVLVLFAGIASVIFGVTYGSYFGLAQFKRYALWQDPMQGNPVPLMYASVYVGAIMITLALVLNIVNQIRRADLKGAFRDRFGILGLVFYWGIIATIVKYVANESHGLLTAVVLLGLGLPALLWLLEEPCKQFGCWRKGVVTSSKTIMPLVLKSLLETFETALMYFANTISFVRLSAYALSHAALMAAILMVAAELRRSSALGSFLSIVILIFGNLAVIVLEGMIACVQALRLEYYEFFGKFFSGGGRPFRPFRLSAEPQGQFQ